MQSSMEGEGKNEEVCTCRVQWKARERMERSVHMQSSMEGEGKNEGEVCTCRVQWKARERMKEKCAQARRPSNSVNYQLQSTIKVLISTKLVNRCCHEPVHYQWFSQSKAYTLLKARSYFDVYQCLLNKWEQLLVAIYHVTLDHLSVQELHDIAQSLICT